jgi:hypothetical protein
VDEQVEGRPQPAVGDQLLALAHGPILPRPPGAGPRGGSLMPARWPYWRNAPAKPPCWRTGRPGPAGTRGARTDRCASDCLPSPA